jgi:hypothetical protein
MTEHGGNDTNGKAISEFVEDTNNVVVLEDEGTARVSTVEHEETIWHAITTNRKAYPYGMLI